MRLGGSSSANEFSQRRFCYVEIWVKVARHVYGVQGRKPERACSDRPCNILENGEEPLLQRPLILQPSRAPGLRRITATKIHGRNIGSPERAAMERIACTSATFPLRSMRMYEKNTGAKFERSLNSRTGRKLSGRQLPSLFDTCPPKRNHRNGFRIVNRRSMSCPSCKSSE